MDYGHQQHHEMVLEKIHESGAEEWFCPVCGRRFLMQWPPNYSRIVLEPGDETAIHSGGKGNLQMNVTEVQEAEEELVAIDAPELVPFEEWCERIDFENLWNKY